MGLKPLLLAALLAASACELAPPLPPLLEGGDGVADFQIELIGAITPVASDFVL
jgi:hypothetical protein